MARVGYCRVSSLDQNLNRQLDSLNNAECDKIFAEKRSGKNTEREELQKMLSYIREKDTVIVHSISRLARSNRDLHNLVHKIKEKGCEIQFLKEGIDTNTPHGKLVFGIFASLAEFQRESIREAQAEGIAAARRRGLVKFGRPCQPLPESFSTVVQEWRDGKIKAVEAIRQLGISKTRFYSLVKE
jgi:DNA invertase Pin-like site-specific DNA recombinase